jgi:hypothetical protein
MKGKIELLSSIVELNNKKFKDSEEIRSKMEQK